MTTNETNVQSPSIMKSLTILTGAAIILTVMHFAASFLMPILMGVFFAVLLTPIYRWLKRRRIPGGLPLLLSIGVLVMAAILLVMLVGNSFSTLASDLAVYGDQFAKQQSKLDVLATNLTVKQLISALSPSNMVNVLSFILGAARGILKQGTLIVLITAFVLAEAPQFKKRIVMAYGPDHFVTRNLINFTGSIISYFGLRVLVNLVVAIGTGIMLWLFNIPNAGLWAVMTFFLSFVPYIGAVIALIPPIILAYAQGGPVLAATIIVLAMLINGASENIVAPMVMGKGLSVSPTVVFLSFLFWMFILGGSGALIAMPLTVGLMLFMSSYEETRGLAAIMGSAPSSE
jgi:AI-2 transport protein TqsA